MKISMQCSQIVISLALFLFLLPLARGAESENTVGQPIVIQAEDYDQGGAGVAYNDSTADNTGDSGYRQKGVDICLNASNDAGPGLHVGHTRAGEWLRYTFNVPAAGQYRINFIAATPLDDCRIRYDIDGQHIGTVAVTNTGDYRTWAASGLDVDLQAGDLALKVEFVSGSAAFDRLEIVPTGRSSTGFELMDHVTYFITTDKKVTVSWDDQTAAEYYQVVLYHVEKGVELPAGEGSTDTNKITFSLPYSGHFVAKIRACDDDLPEPCSDWTESIDDERGMVDNVNKGWWLYGHIAPDGAVTVNQNP